MTPPVYFLLIVFFGIAGGNAIITGADIQVLPIGTLEECTAAKSVIDEQARAGYAKWLTACFAVDAKEATNGR